MKETLTRFKFLSKSRQSRRPQMTTDQKVRLGLMAVTGASVVPAGLGIHMSPLTAEIAGGAGAG
jgi:hypothetical protein